MSRWKRLSNRQIQTIAIALCLAPASALGFRFVSEGVGANPVEDITHLTGEWGLRFLLLSLAITPARRWLGLRWTASLSWAASLGWAAPLRRTFGLASFAYIMLHFATWAWLDLGLDVPAIVEDVIERPYVTAGMSAFVLLAILAATSTRGSMKRLGKRWIRLHQLVYPAAILALLHFFWLIKADYQPAIAHGAVLAVLLLARVIWHQKRDPPPSL